MKSICQASLSTWDIVRLSSMLLLLFCSMSCQQETEVASELDQYRKVTTSTAASPPVGVVVEIDQAGLPEQLPETALLFVYIREPGKRMPIAVEYFAMTDIPTKIPFYWSDQHKPIEVVARISPEGQVEHRETDTETIVGAISSHPPEQVYISFAQRDPTKSAASTMRRAAEHQFSTSSLHDQLTLTDADIQLTK